MRPRLSVGAEALSIAYLIGRLNKGERRMAAVSFSRRRFVRELVVATGRIALSCSRLAGVHLVTVCTVMPGLAYADTDRPVVSVWGPDADIVVPKVVYVDCSNFPHLHGPAEGLFQHDYDRNTKVLILQCGAVIDALAAHFGQDEGIGGSLECDAD